MPDLLQVTESGLYCPAGDFHIDPWRPVSRAVITHAHSDHARWGSGAYLTSSSGTPLLRHRLGSSATIEPMEWGETRLLEGVRISLHPAGHIRGSGQVRVEHRGEVWVASGDYKLQADPTAEPFEPVRCDSFISECTFGLPVYRWPDPEREIAALRGWWSECRASGRVPVLFTYSLGKAQRVLAHLGEDAGPIHAHGAIRGMTDVYREVGVPLPPLTPAAGKGARAAGALVVAPPSTDGSGWLRGLGPVSTAFASGWMQIRGARRRRGADRGFVLSDHADWPGLLTAIEATGASRVALTHGMTAPMVRYLQEKGYDARTLATQYRGEEGSEEGEADAPPAGKGSIDAGGSDEGGAESAPA